MLVDRKRLVAVPFVSVFVGRGNGASSSVGHPSFGSPAFRPVRRPVSAASAVAVGLFVVCPPAFFGPLSISYPSCWLACYIFGSFTSFVSWCYRALYPPSNPRHHTVGGTRLFVFGA